MRHSRLTRIGICAALLAAALQLAGCASDPRYKEGLNWILWNEAEKARLNAMGFPQYNNM